MASRKTLDMGMRFSNEYQARLLAGTSVQEARAFNGVGYSRLIGVEYLEVNPLPPKERRVYHPRSGYITVQTPQGPRVPGGWPRYEVG